MHGIRVDRPMLEAAADRVSIPPRTEGRKVAFCSCNLPPVYTLSLSRSLPRASLLFRPMSFAESVSPFMAHNRSHFEPARRVIQFIIERKPPAVVPSRLAGSLSVRLRTGH